MGTRGGVYERHRHHPMFMEPWWGTIQNIRSVYQLQRSLILIRKRVKWQEITVAKMMMIIVVTRSQHLLDTYY